MCSVCVSVCLRVGVGERAGQSNKTTRARVCVCACVSVCVCVRVRVRFFSRFIVRYLSQFLVWFARPSEQLLTTVLVFRLTAAHNEKST